MLGKFDSLIFFVEDIHQVSKWYADILSTEVQYENENYAFISFSGGKLGFHPNDEKTSGNAVVQIAYWQVASLSESIDVFLSKGAILSRGPLETTLNEYACVICDPFGNTIGLISKNT